jgi:hypothetical protein
VFVSIVCVVLCTTELDNAESIDDTDQSISDDSDVEAEGTELNPPVEPQKVEGKVTGITVFTDNALAKRSAKWKKKNYFICGYNCRLPKSS